MPRNRKLKQHALDDSEIINSDSNATDVPFPKKLRKAEVSETEFASRIPPPVAVRYHARTRKIVQETHKTTKQQP
jgi:hypothetical protein